MDDMIERVARASFRYWRENATRKGFLLDRPQTFDEMPPDEREFALGHARAAIEALREPTEGMVAAGNNYEGVGHSWGPSRGGAGEYISNSGDVYTAMIDAILNTKGGG